MEYDQDKVDEMTLALLYLVASELQGGSAPEHGRDSMETQ